MRRVVDEERFVVGTRSRAKMVEHKWGTSTKEGDAFPNVPVDIGFAGLDPTNRKMSGDLNKGKGAASEKSPTCMHMCTHMCHGARWAASGGATGAAVECHPSCVWRPSRVGLRRERSLVFPAQVRRRFG